MSQSITCPHCKSSISIDQALTAQIEEQFKAKADVEYTQKLQEEKRKLWIVAQEKAQEAAKIQNEDELKSLRESEL